MSTTPTERLVFSHTIEGLFIRGVAGLQSDRLKRRLKEAGVDLEGKLRPAYTFEQWSDFVRITAEEAFPGMPWEMAYRRLGEQLIDGYRDTFMGRAVMAVVKLIGPDKALARTQHTFRSGNNYTESKLNRTGPKAVELWMNEVGEVRVLTAGILQAGLRATGARNPRVDIKTHDHDGVTYTLAWD